MTEPNATRRATIRARMEADSATIAAAIAPDNTSEMATRLESADDGSTAIVTRIERETTGGLHSTVDDYVVNLDVATSVATVAQHGRTNDTDINTQ
ncbi:KEOPS complex subunit Pcc1 [Natronosalvus rutilus]|uniref:KEOPS complex Pcc1-like subunit n=1 Tax=Natronosalvus rutilus TaxID=2953753 RepID=A0A9E7SWR9_9EURY|nr:KEOPS complex subunit Pcc1 [Natronosalvus rutilus]UTF53428.1 KEOPS complex Pcc1-like subunit [Natronosalvus rutilus]